MIAALFLLYVVAEIAALVWVASLIGVAWTACLLLGGSLVGLILMRSQWRRVIQGLRQAGRGEASPGVAIADGALVALGSALMVIPGLVTSALGLLLLIPPTRFLVRPVVILIAGRRAAALAAGAEAFTRTAYRGPGEVIDGEVVTEVFDEETATRPPRVLP